MKKEYDFSQGERGKFFREDVKLNVPIYLEKDVADFVEKLAKKKKVDSQTIVNTMLRSNKDIIQSWQ
jgi:hypothetical protein